MFNKKNRYKIEYTQCVYGITFTRYTQGQIKWKENY